MPFCRPQRHLTAEHGEFAEVVLRAQPSEPPQESPRRGAQAAQRREPRRRRRHGRVVAAEHRQGLERRGHTRQLQRLGNERCGECQHVVDDQVGAACRREQVVSTLAQVRQHELLEHHLAAALRVHGVADHARGVVPVLAGRPHRRELEPHGLHPLAIEAVRRHDRVMSPVFQLERDRHVGVKVAERAERIEDDAGHDLDFTGERRFPLGALSGRARYDDRMKWSAASALVLLTVSAAVIAPQARASEPLTVHDCVRLARERAPEVRIARATSLAARQDSVGHSFDQRPSLSVFGGATVAPDGYYDPTLTDLGSYEFKLGMDWPLRDAGIRAHGRRAAELDARAAIADQRLATRDAGLRAGELALASVRLAEQARSQHEALAWLDRLAVELSADARAGTRGKADAQRAALERDDAVSALETTERASHSIARELARWLAMPPDSMAEVSATEEDLLGPPTATDSLSALARYGAAPEVAQARIAGERARLDLALARRRRETQLSLALDAGLWGTDLTTAVPPSLKETNPNATFSDRLSR